MKLSVGNIPFSRLVSIGFALICPNVFGQASFTFNVVQPATNALVADSLPIEVSVASTYELQSVTAAVDGRSTILTFSSSDNTWSATLSLAGLASGPKTLTVTANDVFGNSGQTQAPFVRDLPPTLTVREPRPGTVARPDFPLDITAADDNPAGAVIRVYYGTNLLAIGTNSLVGSASIPGVDGQFVTVSVSATDSAGQSSNIIQSLCVFTSTNWLENCRAGGPILDVSTDAVLFAEGSALKAKSLVSGAETVLFDQPGFAPVAGGFSAQGAVFQNASEAYDLRNGVLVDLGPCDYGACGVRDNWAVWEHFSGLYLRDEAAGTTTQVTSSWVGHSLGPNGELVYIDMPQKYTTWRVHRYRNGVDTVVASSTTSYYYSGVQSDGAHIVYEKNPYPMTDETYGGLNDGATETILSTNRGANPPVSLAINAGWIAFSATGPTGIGQLWTLSPAGAREQRTFFGSSSTLRALAPNGELLFSSGGQLYLGREGLPPKAVGTWNFAYSDNPGGILWQDGKWWWRLGRSLFQLSGAPMVSSSGRSTGGFKLHVNANPGAQVILQGSTNLADWLNLSTNTVTGTGSLDLTDPASATLPGRFYRAVTPNP